jgi:branched-chain amino acid transport system substrate-binding protein
MRLTQRWWGVLLAAMLGGLVGVTAVETAGEQFLPYLGVREGALKSIGIPQGNGSIDYVTLLNERDGGINGDPWSGKNAKPSTTSPAAWRATSA